MCPPCGAATALEGGYCVEAGPPAGGQAAACGCCEVEGCHHTTQILKSQYVVACSGFTLHIFEGTKWDNRAKYVVCSSM